MTGPLDPDVWAACEQPNPDLPHLSVPVVDAELGAIAVLRLPDGREVYGADSPAGQVGQ